MSIDPFTMDESDFIHTPTMPPGTRVASDMPKDHWIYEHLAANTSNEPLLRDMFGPARKKVQDRLVDNLKEAVRRVTFNGADMRFYPDALIQEFRRLSFGHNEKVTYVQDGIAVPEPCDCCSDIRRAENELAHLEEEKMPDWFQLNADTNVGISFDKNQSVILPNGEVRVPSCEITISGKAGVGKTVLSAILAKHLLTFGVCVKFDESYTQVRKELIGCIASDIDVSSEVYRRNPFSVVLQVADIKAPRVKTELNPIYVSIRGQSSFIIVLAPFISYKLLRMGIQVFAPTSLPSGIRQATEPFEYWLKNSSDSVLVKFTEIQTAMIGD